jgi:hypothetical protein
MNILKSLMQLIKVFIGSASILLSLLILVGTIVWDDIEGSTLSIVFMFMLFTFGIVLIVDYSAIEIKAHQ